MKLLLRAAFVLCLAAGIGRAQPPVDAVRVKTLLASPQLADNSWGAYYAGTLRDPGLRDLLVEHLRAAARYAADKQDSGQFAYVATLFDALIQIGGPVPLDAILPFQPFPQWHPQVLVLLSRQKGTESALLEMRQQVHEEWWYDVEWLAIDNLLFRIRSQPFFTRTLGELNISHTFEIRDAPFDPPAHGWGGEFATGGQPEAPAGFPELVLYYLQDHTAATGGILAPGPHTIYYRRAVSPNLHGDPPRPNDHDRQRDRREYLAAWNGVDHVDDIFTPNDILNWTVDPGHAEGNAAAVAETIDKDLDAQVAAIQAFLAKARQNGAPDLRGTHLRIVVQMQDHRKKSDDPLPPAVDREFTVE